MTSPGGINLILAISQHIENQISAKRLEIRATEKKLEEHRQELHKLLAIREGAGLPDPSQKIETGASVVAEDARASSEPGDAGAPALHVA